ncbi:hypothetical protein BIV57_13605 [Mangrovactinospora gilvigrisea]|uniref:Uncharacterized protein n=1 Tax=Mangrovactinospora gilvigrisea TaxID=1428644 RepID=A0A1J7BEB6_9ACTN|nr:hypothetical protein [Mangrovactinospora gilvigrisea]OIV37019.1 hypothetical protein BIV57_13605 [Mangrovactinospora gilvigrisea]
MIELTTPALHRTIVVTETVNENGAVTYSAKRRTKNDGDLPMGDFVVTPDSRLISNPRVVSIQFGSGSRTDRMDRTNIPNIDPQGIYAVGEVHINPGEWPAPEKGWFLRDLEVSLTPTGEAVPAPDQLRERLGDILRAIVQHWMERDDQPMLSAAWANELRPWRIKQLGEKLAALELEDQLSTDGDASEE